MCKIKLTLSSQNIVSKRYLVKLQVSTQNTSGTGETSIWERFKSKLIATDITSSKLNTLLCTLEVRDFWLHCKLNRSYKLCVTMLLCYCVTITKVLQTCWLTKWDNGPQLCFTSFALVVNWKGCLREFSEGIFPQGNITGERLSETELGRGAENGKLRGSISLP